MKHQFATVVSSCAILLSLTAPAGFAQVTGTGIENPTSYNAFIPPAVGGTYVDPVFGSTVQRISNALATHNSDSGGDLTWIENEYSTAAAFNTNNSNFVLLHESYFALYNGTTGLYMHDLPLEINASSEPRWSRADNVTLYYHFGNALKSYNISTGGINVIHTFSQYSSISGNGEMDISLDGDHFVFIGDGKYIFVYQISTGKTFTAFNTNGVKFDSVYITPKNEVIVSWIATGSARYTGQELFDTNMNFLRQLSHADGHKHLTVDTNGQEVLIWTNSNDSQPIANCSNGIVKINLSNAAQTCLLQLDWSLAVHITAPDGNGYAYVDTEAPANPTPGSSAWVPYTNELLQVKLDGSGTTRWAHHRSRPIDSYNWQPKLDISRDGTRLLFAGNYDLPNIYASGYTTDYADEYLIVMSNSSSGSSGSSSSGTSAGSKAAATTKVVNYAQSNPAIQYSGSWYPNAAYAGELAMDAGSKVQLSFTGTGIQWIGFSDPWSGIATVYIDNVKQATVDTYSATQVSKKVQWSVSNLSNGAHTVTIQVNGQQDSKSAGEWVWVQGFNVTEVTN